MMLKIKEIRPKCLYLFQGQASANSEIVRDLAAAKELVRSANQRFSGYMKIRKYCITQDSWTFVVEILDAESIINRYLAARKQSKKAKPELELTEVWRIVSECIRHWLSRFVRWSNRSDGREGSLRMKRYEKFYFESFEEASSYLDDMMQQHICRSQKMKRFRPSKKKWRLHKIGIGHIFLCCKKAKVVDLGRVFGTGCLDLIEKNSDVLRNLIFSTLQHHLDQKAQKPDPKIE